jgi:hypothetical protein
MGAYYHDVPHLISPHGEESDSVPSPGLAGEGRVGVCGIWGHYQPRRPSPHPLPKERVPESGNTQLDVALLPVSYIPHACPPTATITT